jgi:hypothetical protein
MTRIVRLAIASAMLATFAAFSLVLPALAQQSPSSPAPSNSSAPSGASTGGGAAGAGGTIETTILAYQGLQSDAGGIAAAVANNLPSGSRVIVATPPDVVALLQLRIVLSQIGVLNDRMNELRTVLYGLGCKPTTSQITPAQVNSGSFISPVLSLFSTPGNIQTMVSTIASLTSSTESVTGQMGNFTDPTLVSMVAQNLNHSGKPLRVFVPGVAPPNWSSVPPAKDSKTSVIDSDRNQSFLYQGVRTLELNRSHLQEEAFSAQNNPKKPQCKKDADLAKTLKLIDAASAASDKFVSALIGGPAAPSSSILGEPAASTGAKPGSAKPGPAKPTPGAPNQITQTVNVNPAGSPAAGPSGPTPLQQLLYVDLLMHYLADKATSEILPDVYLISVHALEAGGSQLTKTQTFLGTRQYYSGGAVATFMLIDHGGFIRCSGIAYGYRGFVKADDIGLAIAPRIGAANQAVVPGTQNALPNAQAYPNQTDTPRC